MLFQYDPAILERFPATVGAIVRGQDVINAISPTLRDVYAAEQAAVRERIGATPLSEMPTLAAWRSVFRGFGTDPTKYRSAAEALLRRLSKKGDIPHINALADSGNLIAIRYGLPISMLDRAALAGGITVRFANGGEIETGMHGEDADRPAVGEVVFVDEQNVVVARRWCWRQSADSTAQLHTTDLLVTIEAQHATGRADAEAAARDLIALLTAHCGGNYTYAVLDKDNPVFSD